jgi:ferredoxin
MSCSAFLQICQISPNTVAPVGWFSGSDRFSFQRLLDPSTHRHMSLSSRGSTYRINLGCTAWPYPQLINARAMPELTRFNSGQHADDLLEAKHVVSYHGSTERGWQRAKWPGHPPCLYCYACVAECPDKGPRSRQRLGQYRNIVKCRVF